MQEIKLKSSTIRAVEALNASQKAALDSQLLDTLVCVEALSSPSLREDQIEKIFDRRTIGEAHRIIRNRDKLQVGGLVEAAIHFIAKEANQFGLEGVELRSTVLGNELFGAAVQYIELLREGMSVSAADEAFWNRFRGGAGTDKRGRR